MKPEHLRIRYNKSFELTDTSFTVASYQYSSAGYHSLPSVLDSYRDGRNGSFDHKRKQAASNYTEPYSASRVLGL